MRGKKNGTDSSVFSVRVHVDGFGCTKLKNINNWSSRFQIMLHLYDLYFFRNSSVQWQAACTFKILLERLEIQTSSSFVKI